MTFPTTDLRLSNISVGLLTISCDLHTPLKYRFQRTRDRGLQLQKLTGIGLQDRWDRTSVAKTRAPGLIGCLKQAAFFHVATAEIIAVKIFTFLASGSFHVGLKKTGA